MSNTLIETKDLKKYYPVTAGLLARHVADVKAVDGVSLHIDEGETLGLVGESGCGKSSLGRTILRLEEPTGGIILFHGEDITTWRKNRLKRLRKEAQMVFQDPESSLDPRMTIGDSIGEALLVIGINKEKKRLQKVAALLERVGLNVDYANRYPHELSGGQKQRVGIARALAVEPKLIVADEPVSADLAVIGQVSDRVAVMYLGQIIETATRDELFANPLHPYTVALMSAATVPDPHRRTRRTVLTGEVPSPVAPPPGCRFHTRCPRVMDICRTQPPILCESGASHEVYCHLYD